MRKIFSIVVLFSLLFLFIQCDRTNEDVEDIGNPPISLVGTKWYKYYNSEEFKKYTGGYFDNYNVTSMRQTIVFESDDRFYVDSEIRYAGGYREGIATGNYTYNSSTGKLEIKFHQSFMGIDTDRGKVGEKYLYFRAGISKVKFERIK